MLSRAAALLFVVAPWLQASAAVVFNDGFDDGAFDDGAPVTWVPAPVLPGLYDASSGDFRMAPSATSGNFVAASVPAVSLIDTSVRAQARIGQTGTSIFLTARNQSQTQFDNYFGVVTASEGGGSVASFGRTVGGVVFDFIEDDIPLGFDATLDDVLMQLDVIGTTVSFRVWTPGQPTPTLPLLTTTDSTHASGFVLVGGTADAGASYDFRRVTVGDTPLGDPTAPVALRVNTLTGGVSLEGTGPDSIAITSYLIESPSGSLNPTGWLDGGLAAQRLGAGPGVGESWEVVRDSPNQLIEAYLFGDTPFGPSDARPLGLAYDATRDARDLVFEVATPGGEVLPGSIEYYQAPAVAGDYDLDGDVDPDDYRSWERSFGRAGKTGADGNGDGVVDAADYTVWRDAAGASSAASAAVPEPGFVALVLAALLASLPTKRSA